MNLIVSPAAANLQPAPGIAPRRAQLRLSDSVNQGVAGAEAAGTIYSVFDFAEKDTFLMAAPAHDKTKRPDVNALQKSPLILKRIPVENHAGVLVSTK